MKSRNEMRKPAKEFFASSDDLKKARKLKPVKKDKNPKRTFLDEIDELEDIEMDYLKDELDDEDFFEDEDEL
jgi:hypothetical protein